MCIVLEGVMAKKKKIIIIIIIMHVNYYTIFPVLGICVHCTPLHLS